jgi:2'-5' RNA ligase
MRLFLAAELPDAVRVAVGRWRAQLESDVRGWRWVRPEGIHLTLRFLGEVDEHRDRSARDGWRRVAGTVEPFRVRLGELGCFPERGAPRVLWAGIDEVEPGGALARLASGLEATARERGWEGEARPFRAHLTLARRAREGHPDRLSPSHAPPRGEGWVKEVVLFQSRLDRSGARYTALASFPLGGSTARPE